MTGGRLASRRPALVVGFPVDCRPVDVKSLKYFGFRFWTTSREETEPLETTNVRT
jgi:hypothetical protein